MFDATWKSLAPRARRDNRAARELAELICDYYLHLHRLEQDFPADRLVKVRYEDLVADPRAAVHGIYQALGVELRPDYDALLAAETSRARQYRSRHHYSLQSYGLDREMIYQRLAPIFEEYGFER
jgi:hypothetical protein